MTLSEGQPWYGSRGIQRAAGLLMNQQLLAIKKPSLITAYSSVLEQSLVSEQESEGQVAMTDVAHQRSDPVEQTCVRTCRK